jgi:hypothetical protein
VKIGVGIGVGVGEDFPRLVASLPVEIALRAASASK